MLHYLEVTKPAGWWRGRRVLECGSGTGHLAVGLARLGAHVVATESNESHNGSAKSGFVTMTSWTQKLLRDWPGGGLPVTGVQQAHDEQSVPFSAADLLADTGETAASSPAVLSAGDDACGGTVQFRQLHWGLDDVPPHSWTGFEILLLSELYFEPDLHQPLLETLTRILTPGMTCYSIFVDRPFSLWFLLMLDEEGSFEIEEIEMAQTFGMEEEAIIHAHKITRKAPQAAAAPAGAPAAEEPETLS